MRTLRHSALLAALAFVHPAIAADPAAPASGDAKASGSATAGASLTDGFSASAASATEGSDSKPESESEPFDPRGQQEESTLWGATGLVHTYAADSGAAGTFRLGLIGSYYTGSGFLCGDCALPSSSPVVTHNSDDVTQVGTRLLLSATPLPFLEGYGALRFQSTSNDHGNPRVIDIVGDATLGVKGFMPTNPHRVLGFGGAVDTTLVSSAGGVSFDTANVGIRALGTADFTRAPEGQKPIPLRIHVNAGYVFDNSGILADDIEKSREPILKREQRISRIERFGHDISRVDRFVTGLAVEGVWSWVRPFAEWTLDIPVNRQSHYCGNNISRNAGDDCLSRGGFAETPSRVTIGARLYPWGAADWLRGLGFLAAADIGTGGTSSFIEETVPERPWAVHVGIAWAVDSSASRQERLVEKVVEKALPPPPVRRIEGVVKQAGGGEPVANAIVRYENKSITGMVSNEEGKFQTGPLDPGEYRFSVTAEGFHDGQCTATILADDAAKAGAAKADAAKTDGATATADAAVAAPPTDDKDKKDEKKPDTAPVATAPSDPNAPKITTVTCELEPLPRTATITGVVRNADTTQFVEGATVTITDPLNRQLALKTDAEGTFRFGNVPAGKSKLSVEADGYLGAATELTLEPRKDVNTQLAIHERPKTPNVVVTATELKLKKEVHFLHGSAEVLPDSMAILEEAADVLKTHADITSLEVQGHTDDTGTPEINQKLSADRANAVRQILVDNGVDGSRLTAHGYGQDKPLVPNSSPKNKAKNRRVQLVIQK